MGVGVGGRGVRGEGEDEGVRVMVRVMVPSIPSPRSGLRWSTSTAGLQLPLGSLSPRVTPLPSATTTLLFMLPPPLSHTLHPSLSIPPLPPR